MHKYFTLLFCLLVTTCLFAQADTADVVFKVQKPLSTDSVFVMPAQVPEYPAAEERIFRFIRIDYPQMERDNDIQGDVIIRFIVEVNGSVSNASVYRGVSPGLDAEALRVVRSLKGLTPAKNGNQPVRTMYDLPIKFRLQ